MNDTLIDILGKNHSTIEFINVKSFDDVYELYTQKGGVYVLKSGCDYEFDELSSKEQEIVFMQVLTKKWKVNKHLQ